MLFRRKEKWVTVEQSMTAIILARQNIIEKLHFALIPPDKSCFNILKSSIVFFLGGRKDCVYQMD